VILKVFKKPKVRQHAEEIVEKTKEL
jgi:hypothetical protein